MAEQEQLIKGDICWLDIHLARHKRGIELRVKARPEIEDFMKSLGNAAIELADSYSSEWDTPTGSKDVKIYSMANPIESTTFSLARAGDVLKSPKDNKINLSFLRIPGISNPEGIKFCVIGPISEDTLRALGEKIIAESRNLIRQYILPLELNLRISSQG